MLNLGELHTSHLVTKVIASDMFVCVGFSHQMKRRFCTRTSKGIGAHFKQQIYFYRRCVLYFPVPLLVLLLPI